MDIGKDLSLLFYGGAGYMTLIFILIVICKYSIWVYMLYKYANVWRLVRKEDLFNVLSWFLRKILARRMFTLEGIQFLGVFFLIENKVKELLLSENYNFRVLDFYLYKRYSLH